MTSIADVAVIVPTYNRGANLAAMIPRLLDQDAGPVRYEVLVVDNNSNDNTRAVVQDAIARDTTGRLRYVFEPRQGVSYARNTGVEQTSAPIVVFIDDDGVPGRDWVRTMKEAFDAHPEAHVIGGRIKPDPATRLPAWMRVDHCGPLALQDRPRAAYINARQASACLLGANLGVRRHVFDRVGNFSPDYPRGQDREWEMRVWRAGMQGLYLPGIDVIAHIPADRLTRRYHRRWQATTAMNHARMRFRDCVDADGVLHPDGPRGRTFLGSPLFLYREFAGHLAGWLRSAVRLRESDRFYHETRIWYFVTFFVTRLKNRAPLVPEVPVLKTTTPARSS
jgi:glycosyltransferase involved in cell wall biosynthesis